MHGVISYFLAYVGSGQFFLVQNFEFQYFGGFQKNKYVFGYDDVVDIFWGHHKIGLYLGAISMHFKVFSLGHSTKWGYFLGLLKFQIFFGGA